MQVYSYILGLKTYHTALHCTPWLLELLIRVLIQLHREQTVLQPFRRIELIVYTLLSLSHQVLIYTRVKWSIWGQSVMPKDTTSKQCPNIERGEISYFLKMLHQAGFETARQAATLANLHALAIAPRPSQALLQNRGYYQEQRLGIMWFT